MREVDIKEFYTIVDLLASEYGWTIEYISNLTVAEIRGLVTCILRRKGIIEDIDTIPEDEQTYKSKLISLARMLKLKEDQIKKLEKGEGVTI